MKKISKKEQGVAVIFVLLLISVFLGIVLTMVAIFLPKIRLAGNARHSVTAVYAADSAIDYCLYVNRKGAATLTMDNGSTYFVAPSDCATSPIRAVGTYQGVTRAFEVTF